MTRPLTALQYQIANALANAESPTDIARRRNVSRGTIVNMQQRILWKLRVRTQLELMEYWACPLFHVGMRELNLLPVSVQ